jgi:hypothetical protein
VTESPLLWFPIAVLGVYRLSHLIASEDGPFDLVTRVRGAAGNGVFGRLLDCSLCLSLWLAVPFALLLATAPGEGVMLWLGLSGGSVFLERLTAPRPSVIPLAPYVEGAPMEKEEENVVLRQQ